MKKKKKKNVFIRRYLIILRNPSLHSTHQRFLLLFDAEEAFDKVECDDLFYSFEKVLSWIKILCSSSMAAVHTNNKFSACFNLQRGTRQGCPIPQLHFAAAIELLAVDIGQDININEMTEEVKNVKYYFMQMVRYCTCGIFCQATRN